MPKKLTIKQLLLLAFLLAGLVPATLVSFLSFFQAKAALKKEITHDIQTLSQAVANDVARTIYERVQNVDSWSHLSIMQEAQIGDVDKRLSVFLNELKVSYGNTYRNIYVIDAQQYIVAASSPSQIGQPIPTLKHWFDIRKASKNIKIGKLQDNILPISAQLADENGQAEPFLLVAEFNWENILTILNASAQHPTASALFSADNKILARSATWNEIAGRHSLCVVSEPLNSPLSLGWHIAIKKIYSIATAPTDRLGWVFLALLVTCILFAALLVRPIARMITMPISQLTEFAKNFRQKQYFVPPQKGPKEVHTLSTAFSRMIKELAQYEADLTRAAKLAVAGEMAAAMSHEIRTPLGILRSSAELLQREKNLSQDAMEVLGFIISETERLNKLVSSLIDAARPRQPIFAQHDLNQLVNNCVALLTAQAKAKKVNLHYASQHPMMAELDIDQITQVMMNLLMNAIQILPENGHIEITLAESGSDMILQVADDGPGIPSGDQSSIFEPFFTQRAGGIGLGLAIVKQIVHSHKGEIRYQTSKMHGAQFTITIPKKRM